MIGKTLGHYEILSPLGEGGMGQVYRARDTTLDRNVAIKVLPEDFASDPARLPKCPGKWGRVKSSGIYWRGSRSWRRLGERLRQGDGAMLLRADATHPLEGRAERERAAVAHLIRHRTHGGIRFAQQVGGEGKSPPGEKSHRRLAHDLVKSSRQRGP